MPNLKTENEPPNSAFDGECHVIRFSRDLDFDNAENIIHYSHDWSKQLSVSAQAGFSSSHLANGWGRRESQIILVNNTTDIVFFLDVAAYYYFIKWRGVTQSVRSCLPLD